MRGEEGEESKQKLVKFLRDQKTAPSEIVAALVNVYQNDGKAAPEYVAEHVAETPGGRMNNN